MGEVDTKTHAAASASSGHQQSVAQNSAAQDVADGLQAMSLSDGHNPEHDGASSTKAMKSSGAQTTGDQSHPATTTQPQHHHHVHHQGGRRRRRSSSGSHEHTRRDSGDHGTDASQPCPAGDDEKSPRHQTASTAQQANGAHTETTGKSAHQHAAGEHNLATAHDGDATGADSAKRGPGVEQPKHHAGPGKGGVAAQSKTSATTAQQKSAASVPNGAPAGTAAQVCNVMLSIPIRVAKCPSLRAHCPSAHVYLDVQQA